MNLYWHYSKTAGKTTTSTIEDVMQFVSSVTWSGADTEASRTIEFGLVNSPYDKELAVPTLGIGNIISLYEGGIRMFYGRITGREKTGEKGECSYTAKDYMNNLLKSKVSKKYKNKTAEYIAKTTCKLAGISVGSLTKTKTKIPKLYATDTECYNIIMKAYKKASAKTGVQYFPRMNGSKFEVIEKGQLVGRGYNSRTKQVEEGFCLYQDRYITETQASINIDDMVNRVAIYNKNGKEIGTVSNTDWVTKYGRYQESLTVEKGNGKAEAKKLLKGSSREVSVSALGDQRCIAGAGIRIVDSLTGITGIFWIKSDTHTWANGKHNMELGLTFRNVTENTDVSYSGSSGSSSSGADYVMTNNLSGKKVKALFTGYYPSNSSLEGGYYGAQGNRLNPAKKTCAAPKSIKFGTQIQVLSTHTKQDKSVYKVTDRGGAITVANGRYHFDLLFATKAQANAFGRRTGYAIIGDGTGYKVAKVEDSSAKGDKIVAYAKKFIGKVRYVLGAASPQNGRCDCSGYTMYVYKHAIGKSIPHYSVSQAKLGKKITKMSSMQKGDIIVMHTGWRGNARNIPDHVGIYAGNNKILQVGHSGCTLRSVSTIKSVFLYARRLV